MTKSIDYKEVGLICGLEVHQQLLTEKKLFCRCPAGLYTRDHDGTVLRHMRPTLSELGEYDGTALMEFKTKKNIVYLLHQKNVCTYEMDDTPPFLLNTDALDVAIEQCLMLGCDIVDEVHIARKQYLDGSIPTGFQRTAIVGVNGRLPFRNRELTIIQVSVEEDSCREVSDKGHLVVWRTDRLGIPLIETVTGPELHTPDEVAEAILLVGRVCRSTGHVRVGMGASRQDVNVSVRGGRRVEIKGVPQAGWAPALVHGEAVRQVNLLKLREELHSRGFTEPDSVKIEHTDVTDFFSNSVLDFLHRENWERFVERDGRRRGFELLNGPFCVRAIRLPGLAGTLSWPGQPDLTFAHELIGRVRVIACLDQQPIILHSEKWPDYRGAKGEIQRLKKKTGCGANDSLVVVWGIEQDTLCAAEEIRLRYADAVEGIPNETRQPFADGSTDFERILPGPDRMYPDTDSPPQQITRERTERLRDALPELPWLREKRYSGVGVPLYTIYFLIRRGGARLVDLVVDRGGADVRRACFFFGERIKGLRRDGVAVDGISDDLWCELFSLVSADGTLFEDWKRIVSQMATAGDRSMRDIVEEIGLDKKPVSWREDLLEIVQTKQPDHPNDSVGQQHRFLMGTVMKNLRGQIRAKDVSAALHSAMEGQA